MSTSLDAAGFVLAGGQSSRMGSEKALIQLAGELLVVHAVRILRRAGLTVQIAGARSPLQDFAPIIMDTEQDRGPLGGICAALAATSERRAVFIPVDMPLLPVSMVALLLEEARVEEAAVTVPAFNGFTQTFPAVVDRAAYPWLRATLEGGHGGCFAAFQAAAAGLGQSVKIVSLEHALKNGRLAQIERLPVENWFLNVNEPADLALAEACLASLRA